MAKHYLVASEIKGVRVKTVQYLIYDDALQEVRSIEQVADIDAENTINAATLWSSATPIADGVRTWLAFKQRGDDEVLDSAIFAATGVVLAGGTLAQINTAVLTALQQSTMQAGFYASLHAAIQAASDEDFRTFVTVIAVALAGKVGQR